MLSDNHEPDDSSESRRPDHWIHRHYGVNRSEETERQHDKNRDEVLPQSSRMFRQPDRSLVRPGDPRRNALLGVLLQWTATKMIANDTMRSLKRMGEPLVGDGRPSDLERRLVFKGNERRRQDVVDNNHARWRERCIRTDGLGSADGLYDEILTHTVDNRITNLQLRGGNETIRQRGIDHVVGGDLDCRLSRSRRYNLQEDTNLVFVAMTERIDWLELVVSDMDLVADLDLVEWH